jgi:hypothetical protein
MWRLHRESGHSVTAARAPNVGGEEDSQLDTTMIGMTNAHERVGPRFAAQHAFHPHMWDNRGNADHHLEVRWDCGSTAAFLATQKVQQILSGINFIQYFSYEFIIKTFCPSQISIDAISAQGGGRFLRIFDDDTSVLLIIFF